jgi:hypothetical protein
MICVAADSNIILDEVDIKVKDMLQLLRASTGKRNAPPLNYFISNATFEGHATPDASHFRCRFEVGL